MPTPGRALSAERYSAAALESWGIDAHQLLALMHMRAGRDVSDAVDKAFETQRHHRFAALVFLMVPVHEPTVFRVRAPRLRSEPPAF